MQKPKKENNLHKRGSDRLQPSVGIVVGGKSELITCDLLNDNVVIYYQDEPKCGQFFNKTIKNNCYKHDLFCFLADGFNFMEFSSLSDLIKTFLTDDKRSYGAIYTDYNVVENDEILFTKINPVYDRYLPDRGVIVNTPLLVKSSNLPIFNEEIEHLSLWDGFLKLSKTTVLYHYPKPMFKNTNLKAYDFEPDLRRIQDEENRHT